MKRNRTSLIIILSAFVFVLQMESISISPGFVLEAYVAHTSLSLGDNITVNPIRYNVTLWVRDWKNSTGLGGLNVTMFDLSRGYSYSRFTNDTGHIYWSFLDNGSYVISVQKENRIVGYDKINIMANATFLIKTWSYDFNITLVGKSGELLANHTIILHDQMTFQEPNYTIIANEVKWNQKITILTDRLGMVLNQADTDNNGTVHFPMMWNGTYRLSILGKETWIEEYVLGELVRTPLEPASGEHIFDLQGSANVTFKCVRVNQLLRFVSGSGSDAPIKNASVYVRNLIGHLFLKDQTNDTGYIERRNVYVIDSDYIVSAWYGPRLISYKAISITKTELFTFQCYNYNLTVTCVDWDGKPLANHIVMLYDQVVFFSPTNITVISNQTGPLINLTRTDDKGSAYFSDIWNGTYWIKVLSSDIIGDAVENLQKTDLITITCNKTYMVLRFITLSGNPLSGATIIVSDNAGNLVFRSLTDENGYVSREGMYVGRYTVNVEWMRTQVWSGYIDIPKDRDETKQCTIYKLSLHCIDQFGNSLPNAEVNLEKQFLSPRETPITLTLETDDTGSVSLLLPPGSYETSSTYGIYSGSEILDLNNDQSRDLRLNLRSIIYESIFLVAVPLFVFTILLERRRLRTPLEVRKYKNMLSKLEFMYKNGQVEYRIYRKLREEYESRIMELGGREMR